MFLSHARRAVPATGAGACRQAGLSMCPLTFKCVAHCTVKRGPWEQTQLHSRTQLKERASLTMGVRACAMMWRPSLPGAMHLLRRISATILRKWAATWPREPLRGVVGCSKTHRHAAPGSCPACRLPRAATCFSILYLPGYGYSSQAVLERKLLQAIGHSQIFDEGEQHAS